MWVVMEMHEKVGTNYGSVNVAVDKKVCGVLFVYRKKKDALAEVDGDESKIIEITKPGGE